MPKNLKFPPSVEIKRVIAAALRAGLVIRSIEIHQSMIILYPKDVADDAANELSAYDYWKMSEGKDTQRVIHADPESDAPPTKSTR